MLLADRALSTYVKLTGRKLFDLKNIDTYEKHGLSEKTTPRLIDDGDLEKANLVSSELSGQPGMHMPVIDCDYGIQAIGSTTQGNFHLYIDKPITWEQYKALLDGFYKAGLIQKAWYNNALNEKRSYVRLPHIKKVVPDKNIPAYNDEPS